ncbi:hypothetical protein Desaci_1494 [Desulfosporosinus acidiphilus SJ4]|uniref:Uncharacterized protein n=1 Tax=Desulfosporosinus acidiphilus (strain DSM 22704 / JCM 16185 / SJ4) TaxID=646529 RepID=I4D3Y4_DESAJ|nr:hypothetical protein Desaci_1494 [Desulfosporosinus acidiphilus SJ4]
MYIAIIKGWLTGTKPSCDCSVGSRCYGPFYNKSLKGVFEHEDMSSMRINYFYKICKRISALNMELTK